MKLFLIFFMFCNKEIVECAPYENEFNRICQLFNLFCIDGIINFCCKGSNFTKSNTRPWVLFTFFKLYKWYQIAKRIIHGTLLLNPMSYMPVVLWSFNSSYRTGEERTNTRFFYKQQFHKQHQAEIGKKISQN